MAGLSLCGSWVKGMAVRTKLWRPEGGVKTSAQYKQNPPTKKHIVPSFKKNIPRSGGKTDAPVGGAVVAVVGQEVEVELPEDVQCDAAVWRRHVVVGLTEHGVEAVQRQVLGQQPVGQAVDLQQPLQLLDPRAHPGTVQRPS